MFIFQPSLHFLFCFCFSFILNGTGVTAEERCYSPELNSGVVSEEFPLSYSIYARDPPKLLRTSDRRPGTEEEEDIMNFQRVIVTLSYSHVQVQSLQQSLCLPGSRLRAWSLSPISDYSAFWSTHAFSPCYPRSLRVTPNSKTERDRGVIR